MTLCLSMPDPNTSFVVRSNHNLRANPLLIVNIIWKSMATTLNWINSSYLSLLSALTYLIKKKNTHTHNVKWTDWAFRPFCSVNSTSTHCCVCSNRRIWLVADTFLQVPLHSPPFRPTFGRFLDIFAWVGIGPSSSHEPPQVDRNKIYYPECTTGEHCPLLCLRQNQWKSERRGGEIRAKTNRRADGYFWIGARPHWRRRNYERKMLTPNI